MADDKGAKPIVEITGKDILGLQKPLNTVAKRICDAVEGFFAPINRRRDAKAAVRAIGLVGDALAKQGLEIGAADAELGERARIRLTAQQFRQQENLEAVMHMAVEEADTITIEPPKVPERQSVDPDWFARFMDRAQVVSNADMQRVWARVMAREAHTPGSFSYRALDALGSMSGQEAEVLRTIGQFAYHMDGWSGVFNIEVMIGPKPMGIRVGCEILKAIGLVFSDSLLASPELVGDPPTARLLVSGIPLRVTGGPNGQKHLLSTFRVTPLGNELMRLIDVQPQEPYVAEVIRQLQEWGLVVERLPS